MPASRSRSLAAATCSLIVLGDSGGVFRNDGRVFELFRLVVHADVIEELSEVAVQHAFELVRREVDAVIRNPALREVVSTDLL